MHNESNKMNRLNLTVKCDGVYMVQYHCFIFIFHFKLDKNVEMNTDMEPICLRGRLVLESYFRGMADLLGGGI